MYGQEQSQSSGDIQQHPVVLECAFTIAADFLFSNHLSHFIYFLSFLLKLKSEIYQISTSETIKPME